MLVYYMTIGERVKELRERSAISQDSLAKAAGITRQSVARIEAGKQTPSALVVAAIATHFRVSADYLLGLGVTIDSVPTEVRDLCALAVRSGYDTSFRSFLLWLTDPKNKIKTKKYVDVAKPKAVAATDDGLAGKARILSAISDPDIKRLKGLSKQHSKQLRAEAIAILRALEIADK